MKRPEKPEHFPAPWADYYGDNHAPVVPRTRRMGSVSFASHLGKPLSSCLWEDLVERFGMVRLRVFYENEFRHTDSWSGRASITLGADGNVKDIRIEV